MRRSRTATLSLAALLLALLAGAGVLQHIDAAAFVARAAGAQGLVRHVAERHSQAVSDAPVLIPWRNGHLRGRRYQPARPKGRPILLLPGVHAAGIEEPRLIGFAREIAATGHPTITVELTDLTHYLVTPRTTDMIEDAGRWLAEQPGVPEDRRIGLMGISFAGGLSIVAAGRPAIRDRIAFVLSLGGHGDLPRTLHYLATGIQADGLHRPPHDYGVAIILLAGAERVVPAEQVPPLRASILSFLEASHLDMVDKAEGARGFARARALAEGLPEPSRRLMGYVNDRNVGALGALLAPHLPALGEDPALSPTRGATPSGVIHLLHGADDNVIPAIESALLAETLRERGATVHFLATPLITHAEVDRAGAAQTTWALVRFWSGVLGE
jgi:dienelactone hydrolase